MASDDEKDQKAAREFRQEADDFLAGRRKEYPTGLDRPLYIDPKRWPHKFENGSKLSSLLKLLKEQPQGKLSILLTPEQRAYLRRIEQEELVWIWNDLFWLFGIDRSKLKPAEYLRQMATELAERPPVPALTITNQPPKWPRLQSGPQLKRSLYTDADLVNHIRDVQADLKKAEKPNSVRGAAAALLKSEPARWGHMKAKSIESEFLAAKRRLAAEHKKGEVSDVALDTLGAHLRPKP